MGFVEITEDTSKYPLTMAGRYAGECWGAPTGDKEKNYRRGVECLTTGHFRTQEFGQIYMVISGFSARFMRELYTQIGGMPTRLQASTRYIDYANKGLKVIVPHTVEKLEPAATIYNSTIETVVNACKKLEELGIPKEDVANLLPLGMESKMVIRLGAREYMQIAQMRMCARAYWEFREFMKIANEALSAYSEEWAFFVKEVCKPKCEICGFCTERYSCGRKPTKAKVEEWIELGKMFEKLSQTTSAEDLLDDGK